MESIINAYIQTLSDKVYNKICGDLENETAQSIVKKYFVESIKNKKNLNVQIFYFKTLQNKEEIAKENFFKNFWSHYSLRIVYTEAREYFEKNKNKLKKHINKPDGIVQLYFDHFHKVKLNTKDGEKNIDFGSFFTKLNHTFNPDDYCLLDNPIKKYFRLNNESFFISMLVVNKAFSKWANNNKGKIESIREELKNVIDNNSQFKKEGINIAQIKITDFKILDIIYWSKANSDDK